MLRVGIETPCGTEMVTHALLSVLAENPAKPVRWHPMEVVNAVNSTHRAAMFAAVQQWLPVLQMHGHGAAWVYGD